MPRTKPPPAKTTPTARQNRQRRTAPSPRRTLPPGDFAFQQLDVLPPEILDELEDEFVQFVEEGELTPKEMLFINYYTAWMDPERTGKKFSSDDTKTVVRPWNATQAAIAAGYSPATAGQVAVALLKKPHIRKLIRERLKAYLVACDIRAYTLYRHLYAIATVNPRRYERPDGTLKDLHELTDDEAFAVSAVEVDEIWEGQGKNRRQVGVKRKLRFWDKLKALDAMRAVITGVDKTFQLQGPGGGPIQMEVENLSAEEAAQLYQEMLRASEDGDGDA